MELQKQNFIQIVNSNQGIVRSLCKVYYTSYEDQKDAFQDIILQLWKSFDTFRGEAAVSTWIYRVSLNTLLAKARKERNRVIIEPLAIAGPKTPMVVADGDNELLHIALNALKDVDKAIVILFLEGYKNKEISQMLAMTSTNVSTRLNRVKSELRAKFKKHHYEFK